MSRFARIDDRNEDLRELLAAEPIIAAELSRLYELSWLHHEAGLEGYVLSESELKNASEAHHVVSDAAEAAVITRIRNHRQALARMREEAAGKRSKLGVPLVLELHEQLDRGVILPGGRDKAGLRKEMPLHRTYFHEILQPDKIPAGLEAVAAHTGTPEFKELHPIAQAAWVHWELMRVFPFVDNSGRVARLIQNLYLLRGGYEPVIIHTIDRSRYFESLKLSHAALRGLLADSIENSLENAFRFVKQERETRRKRSRA